MVKDEKKEIQVKFAALRTRLVSKRARKTAPAKAARGQRGAILIEALVMSVVGALAMSGYLVITTGTQNVVRHSQSIDVIDQYATSVVEEMRSMPWSAVANCALDGTNIGTAEAGDEWGPTPLPNSVYHMTCPSRYIKWYEAETVQNVKISRTVRVSWDPSGTVANPALPGRKKVEITLTWKPVGSAVERERKVTAFRSSTPTEASAVTLPTDGAPL